MSPAATGRFCNDDLNMRNTYSLLPGRPFLTECHIHMLNKVLPREIQKTGVLLFLNIGSKVWGNAFF
jgi:hypothetical protein